MFAVAAAATLPAAAAWWALSALPGPAAATVVVAVYAVAYLAAARLVGVGDLDAWIGRLRRAGRR
jgi:hypothetical protein